MMTNVKVKFWLNYFRQPGYVLFVSRITQEDTDEFSWIFFGIGESSLGQEAVD